MPATITPAEVEPVLKEALVGLGTPAEAINPHVTLEALDIDSLDLVELAQIIEERFGVQLKTNDLKDMFTLGDLVAVVVSRA
jgi:acyl carrier protein